MRKVTIISLGWLGLALYKKLAGLKVDVSGAYFNTPKNISNEYSFNINTPDINQHIFDSDIVIISIPPSKITDEEKFIVFLKSLSNKKLIFISSTSVYGNQGNVDERTTPVPESQNGKRLLKWEEFIKTSFKNYQIIRSAGQYGAGRHPGKFLSGRTGIRGGEDCINLISQNDLVEITLKTINAHESNTINAVNINHPLKKEYYTDYCKRNDLPLPLFDEAEFSSINLKKVSSIYPEYLIKSSLA